MKMKLEHYEHMKSAIATLLNRIGSERTTAELMSAYREAIGREAKARDVSKRFRWDMLFKAGLGHWICDNLYGYIDDTHIDTALRRIVLELEQ